MEENKSKIEFSKHTLERAEERGATKKEIEDTIQSGEDYPAKNGRKGKEKVFDYDKEWNGKYYAEKLVRVIFVVYEKIISTVTVIVRFGKFTKEEENK